MKTPFLRPGVLAFAGLGASLVAGSVSAQTAPDPQPSAVIAQPQAASTQSDNIDAQIAAWTNAPPAQGDGAPNPNAAPAGPRQIHGEAGVAFGSNGYRSGYISTDIPLGKSSDLGIAVGESEIKPKHLGTIREKSLALSLTIGNGAQAAPINCGSPTVATDGRYLEPLWEARLHGEALARDQQSCGGPAYGPAYGAPIYSGLVGPRPAE